MFGFDDATHEMRLDAVAPWTTVDEVLAQMEFRPLIAEKMDVLHPPAEDELKMIRSEIDPSGLSTGKGDWVTIDATTGKKIA
jgi:glutaconate CoA-transferase subunit B